MVAELLVEPLYGFIHVEKRAVYYGSVQSGCLELLVKDDILAAGQGCHAKAMHLEAGGLCIFGNGKKVGKVQVEFRASVVEQYSALVRLKGFATECGRAPQHLLGSVDDSAYRDMQEILIICKFIGYGHSGYLLVSIAVVVVFSKVFCSFSCQSVVTGMCRI